MFLTPADTAQADELQEDTLHIVGDMADKIKNNVKKQVQQFSWKMKFPKDIPVNEIQTEGIMLLNKQLKRVRCEFVNYPSENAIMLVPQTPYKTDQEYFFWAKFRNKEVCIAFVISEDRKVQTFDRKTSMDKLQNRHRWESKRAEKVQTLKEEREAAASAASVPKKEAPVSEVID